MTNWYCAAGTWSHDNPPSGFSHYVFKTVTLNERSAHYTPLIQRLPDQGLLNRIGIINPGIEAFMANVPEVPGFPVLSVTGDSIRDFECLGDRDFDGFLAVELNLSCYNTEKDPQETMAPVHVHDCVSGFRRTCGHTLVGVKLSPLATQYQARAAVNAGADYLCLTNTLPTALGGLSGRPLRGMSLYALDRIANSVDVLIIGGGGIMDREADAKAYLSAGAHALFQGTANIYAGHTPEALITSVT